MKNSKIAMSEKNHFYKVIAGVEMIIALFIIVSIIIVISLCQVSDKEIDITEFEKIGLYDYFEKSFIDYSIFDNYKSENQNTEIGTLGTSEKIAIVIENYLNKNNKKAMTDEEFLNDYIKYFGEEKIIEARNISLYTNNYIFDENTGTVKKNENAIQDIREESDNDISSLKKEYKVQDITKNDNNYIILFNINADDGKAVSYIPSEKNQSNDIQKRKLGTAKLTVKIEDERYVIVDYVQILEQ